LLEIPTSRFRASSDWNIRRTGETPDNPISPCLQDVSDGLKLNLGLVRDRGPGIALASNGITETDFQSSSRGFQAAETSGPALSVRARTFETGEALIDCRVGASLGRRPSHASNLGGAELFLVIDRLE
jgi:hypothetical protein